MHKSPSPPPVDNVLLARQAWLLFQHEMRREAMEPILTVFTDEGPQPTPDVASVRLREARKGIVEDL